MAGGVYKPELNTRNALMDMQSAQPVERTSVFPFAQYSDGSARLAWPGLIAAPVEAFNRMMTSGFDPSSASDDEWAAMARDGFEAGGLAPVGGLAAGAVGAVPEGAVAANGGGWVSKLRGMPDAAGPAEPVWYHGTPNANFDTFDVTKTRPRNFKGPYFTPDADEASAYSGAFSGEPGAVIPAHLSVKNPFVWDANDLAGSLSKAQAVMPDVRVRGDIIDPDQMATFSDALVRGGYDAVDTSVNGATYERVALKPGTVRSALTGELLYANSPTGAAAPLAFSDYDTEPRNALMPR